MGRIVVAPFDLSRPRFSTDAAAEAFLKPLLGGTPLPSDAGAAPSAPDPNDGTADDLDPELRRQEAALGAMNDAVGGAPAPEPFDLARLAFVLIGVAAVAARPTGSC